MNERLLAMEAEFLKALANPTRIRILKHLKDGEKCVCKFTEDLEIEQSNVSQHLAILRKQDILKYRKEGLNVIYEVKYPEIFTILEIVEEVLMSQVHATLDLLNERNKIQGGE